MMANILDDMYINEKLVQDSGYTEIRIPEDLREKADYILIQRESTLEFAKLYEIIKAPEGSEKLNTFVSDSQRFMEEYRFDSNATLDDTDFIDEANILVINMNGKWLRNY